MTKPIKYDFFGQLGDNHLETFATAFPAQYASELAALRGLDPDEIIWEPAGGTVDGFDAFFPPPMTPGQMAERELVEALQYEINQAVISLDAADIKPGKLHERVAGALELLTHYRWEAGHYKALYMKRIEFYGGETK